MVAVLDLLLPLGLLCTAATSTALYPQDARRYPVIVSDFQKNNVSASWAPGHPKEWNNKDAIKYTFSDGGPYAGGYTDGAIHVAHLSSDEKYLVTVNRTYNVAVVNFATGVIVSRSQITTYYTGSGPSAMRVLARPKGGYDVLVSMDLTEVQRLQLSPNGTQIGDTTKYVGGLLPESVSHSGRRFLVADQAVNPYYTIYDLDDANVNIVLENALSVLHDCSWSPDDQYVATRTFGTGSSSDTRLFNATSGALIRDFGNTESQILRISPDGNLLATSYNYEAVQLWSLKNATAEPVKLDLPSFNTPFLGWNDMQWSPDGAYLAVGGYSSIVVWQMTPSPRMIQSWRMDAYVSVMQLTWLEGSKRLAYRTFGGLEVYDMESNLKYRWGFNAGSHWVESFGSTFVAKNKGWIGGLDSDSKVRFWEYLK